MSDARLDRHLQLDGRGGVNLLRMEFVDPRAAEDQSHVINEQAIEAIHDVFRISTLTA